MGKSPGKWIKTVFFGKKSSRTSYHKRRENATAANAKEVLVAVRASETDVSVAPSFSSQHPYANERDERELEVERNEAANISNDDGISLLVIQGINSPSSTLQDSQYDPERVKEEQAATIVQAAFRGYLARRAFGALKGIIRLQALFRGHLVRRQAITTLCCMMGIVKLQAHVRGVMARHSDGGLEVQKKLNQMSLQESNPVVSLGVNMSARIGKLSANAFVRKIVALSLPIMPLLLHVDAGEPNSVWNWLERWSASCFWKPVPQPRKASSSKLQRKQTNGHVDIDTGRPKLSVRRIRSANLVGTSVQATSEFDKPKRNLRKVSSNPTESSVQENPQNEFEKVKRDLRKVHNPVVENSVQPEVEFEKPKPSSEKVSSTTNIDIVEHSLNSLAEKTNKEMALTVPKPSSEKVSSTTNMHIVEQSLNGLAEKTNKEMALTVNSLAEKTDKEMALTVNSPSEKMKNDMSVTVTSSTEEMRETTSRNSSAEKMNKEMALKINNSAENMKKETATPVNSSAEKMKKETALTVNSSVEKVKKETALTVNSSVEKVKKVAALTINKAPEKMKKEMAMTVNSSTEKMRQETDTINNSAEKMKERSLTVNSLAEKVKKEIAVKVNGSAEKMKETALTVNNSAEKVKKEIAVKVNGSAEKMKETALTVNSSAEKVKKEIAVKVNGSAEKVKKEIAVKVNGSAEKVKKERVVKVNGSAEKMKETTSTVNSSAEKVKKEIAVKVNGSAEKVKKERAVEVNGSAEKMKKETTVTVSKSVDIETMSWPLVMNETSDIFHADPAIVDSKPSIGKTVKGNKTFMGNVELKRKENSMNNENQKSSRKAFNPANRDHTENGPQISPPVPSYMAATESAKAKLRLQDSPRSGQDGGDKNNLTRHQSLPFSDNGKSSSQSPRGQRLVHAGKEGSKSDRPLSSRDRNAKATQVEWRR